MSQTHSLACLDIKLYKINVKYTFSQHSYLDLKLSLMFACIFNNWVQGYFLFFDLILNPCYSIFLQNFFFQHIVFDLNFHFKLLKLIYY